MTEISDKLEAMSRCDKCGAEYPSAPIGTIHKCGRCSGGYCSPITRPTKPADTGLVERLFDGLVVAGRMLEAGSRLSGADRTHAERIVEEKKAAARRAIETLERKLEGMRRDLTEDERAVAFKAAQLDENCVPEMCFDAGWDAARTALKSVSGVGESEA